MFRKKRSLFDSAWMARLLDELAPIRCLDIGARGGPTRDLEPLAPSAEVYCFEPDREECDRLNQRFAAASSPFRAVRFFPVALSEKGGRRTLYLTEHRGTSSLLPPIPEVGRKFSRPRYTAVEKTVEIDTVPLDTFLDREGLTGINYIKIDVEGLELEILRSAGKLLSSSLLAIRSEVNFMPYREGQPSYAEIEAFLRPFHFMPMGFAELHHWRRTTPEKHLKEVRSRIPFSRGQIVHGDMIFLRDPDSIPDTAEGVRLLLKSAALALTYGFVDHAAYVFSLSHVRTHLEQLKFPWEAELERASRTLATLYRRKRLSHLIPRDRA